MINKLLSLLAAILAVAPTFGHSVWIEPGPEGQLIIRFAEPDGKFEKSPGHLDELSLPVAWKMSASGPVPLEVQKKSDHFLILRSSPDDSVQIETRFQVMAAPGRPGRLPCFYARWNPSTDQKSVPALLLDIGPTGKEGEMQVLFRGKPLAGVKAVLRTPDEKEETLTADDAGYIRFESKQPGQHMLSIAHHRESLPGFAGGRAYDLTSHNAALTWLQK